MICPTIYSSIKKENRQRIIELCYKYDPFKKKESNELFEIKRLLQTVGNQTFIKYYTEFQSKKNINFALLFKNENWQKTSINAKIFSAKKIFENNWQKNALEIILSSRSDEKTINNALEIFSKEYPNEELKSIRFIRPEFIFGENIIEKLFDGYTIHKQYRVEKYIIDWYIPELNIAIEFDEKHHNKNIKQDNKRSLYIEKKIKCKFIRYKF